MYLLASMQPRRSISVHVCVCEDRHAVTVWVPTRDMHSSAFTHAADYRSYDQKGLL